MTATGIILNSVKTVLTILNGKPAVKVFNKVEWTSNGKFYYQDTVYSDGVLITYTYAFVDDAYDAQLVHTNESRARIPEWDKLLQEATSPVVEMFVNGLYSSIRKELYNLTIIGRYDSIRVMFRDLNKYGSNHELTYDEYKQYMSLCKLMYNVLNS